MQATFAVPDGDPTSTETMVAETMTENESPAEIANRLLWESSYHPVRRVKCSFHEGILTMDGCLPTFHLKQVAQTAVYGIDGVVRIENRIEVTGL